ncbi:hypothetical protein [Bdellovibrio reynosensis]|uniref:Lipoprotein n=1 Tax=Bdellovibrio reynosensis TaxID=2835041 RepID=A0ABY4C9F5_9BACT|nr:hypothetical protein [Bdellovibrio reynosensis]UOF00527.1 hypothetical protein MNR06_12540 [Bdellovibrio reynosensis]
MKVRFNKTTWRAASGIFASFLLVVSFQNCGKAGFDANLDSSLDPGVTDAALSAKYGEAVGAKVAEIPFAFEATFDTITYNSCAETQIRNNPAFFSIKAGSYSTGGISVKNEFFDYADQNFKPLYPATQLSDNQYKSFLADSPKNNGATPTMAVRVKNSLTDVYTATSKVELWTDVVPLVGNLTDSLVMDSIATKGVSANYFPFSPEQRVMEANLNFNSSEELAEEFRNIFMSSGVLSLTYMSDATEIYKVRAAADTYPVKSAYGKGYTLTFAPYAMAGAAINNPSRVLSSVGENDLSVSGAGRSWSCGRVFKVVRAQDAATLCPAHTYNDLKNSAIRSELAIARRHLRADQWDVNVSQRCVVPKGGVSCYKEESVAGAPVVEYDLTKECFRPNGSYGGAIPNSKCMHFVTVCTRD